MTIEKFGYSFVANMLDMLYMMQQADRHQNELSMLSNESTTKENPTAHTVFLPL